MVFTAVNPGELIKSAVLNANLRHTGRFNTHMIPLNNSGVGITDGSLDLGSLVNYWGNLYLGAGKKIYVGGIEFKGGGSGSSLEVVEMKSHFEKQGINYPISAQGALNESFTNTENITITPRVSYVSGTTLIADYNKTDLDLMNATTGWTAGTNTPTIAQDTTNKIEGTGSVKMTKASLNGSIDMYKTFTAFSLIDNLLSFSFYPDTITNVTRFYVKIESTAGNDKTYYVPVANITATAWNHISIDVTNDVADASTGTLVPGSITKIYFGYTTSSSQTVNVSVDFVVYQPNWLLPVPYTSYIWDATNQEALYIASVAGTANHQRRTYTITALTNGYAVSVSYAKLRNVTIANNQGVFPSGLSGAVALTTYDLTVQELSKLYSGATLEMSQRWWDEEFKINALASTTTTGLYSATDKKAYFKSGDKVIIYDKKYNGRKYTSRYNSNANLLANFKILTLSADATYSGTTITLTHTGIDNTGSNTSYWYAVRYSAEMLYKVENMADNGSLNTLTPTVFLPKGQGITYPKYIHSHWKMDELVTGNAKNALKTSGLYDLTQVGTVPVNVNLGKLGGARGRFNVSANYFTLAANAEYDVSVYLIEAWVKINSGGINQTIYSKTNGSTTGIQFNINTGNGIDVIHGGIATLSGTNALTLGVWNYVVVAQLANTGANNWRIYLNGSLDKQGTGTSVNSAAGSNVYCGVMNITGNEFVGLIDSLVFWNTVPGSWTEVSEIISKRYNFGLGLEYDNNTGYIVRGSVDNQSGDKLVTGSMVTRKDTTNQNPIVHQRDANLA